VIDQTANAPEGSAVPTQESSPEVTARDKRRGRSFELVADRKGAMINGGLYSLYAVASLVFAVRADANSMWFYVFYFLTFLAVFQGGTIVLRQCLHLLPKSTVRLDVVGKSFKVTNRKGEETEISRDIDYTRRKSTVILQGKTHDNQSYSEVIREGALDGTNLDALVSALKRFR